MKLAGNVWFGAGRGAVAICIVCAALTGCVVNPVTGQRDLGFVSTEQQINIGRQQYVPAQQMQGGRYRVDPELTAYVNSVGQKVAKASPVDLPYEFVVLNNSVPNAWALPGGKVAINRGLLTELKNEAELAAVLGHEVVHAAARHGARSMERGMLLQGALMAAMIGARNTEYAGTVLGGAQLAAGLVTQKYGRDAERESDYYGTRYMAQAGYDPYAAVTLQETFVRLSEGRQTNWVEGLFASHPPSQERVNNNKQLVKTLKEEGFQGGAYNADAYQAAMRQLRKDAAAYAAYDAAREALANKQVDAASSEIAKALNAQPAEAAFHGLRGDIRRIQKKYDDARINYDRAIERDPEYFAYYIGRGLSNAELGQRDAAKSDLNASLKLLPTAVAYQTLGTIAEAEGNADAAVRYYQAASEAQGQAGRTALASMLRLDVPRHPAQYIAADVVRDSNNRLLLRVANKTALPLYNVQIRVELNWASGGQALVSTLQEVPANATQVKLLTSREEALLQANAYALSASTES